MVINRSSQLALMMDDLNLQVELLQTMKDDKSHMIDVLDSTIEMLNNAPKDEQGNITVSIDECVSDLEVMENNQQIDSRLTLRLSNNENNFIDNNNSKLYLICDGVDKCSKMIHIGDNFSSKALSNIEFGKHTYLLGKDEMTRFISAPGVIKGIYWCRSKKIAFEYGFDLQDDGYYYDSRYSEQFNKVAKIITFVYLGDIEVLMIEQGRNNHKPKKDGKITNTSSYNVYVVDSSWNKLIIRTEGFAVMGHFRLQPWGPGFIDRKLIWINAFEKHGYKRQPKGRIIQDAT